MSTRKFCDVCDRAIHEHFRCETLSRGDNRADICEACSHLARSYHVSTKHAENTRVVDRIIRILFP